MTPSDDAARKQEDAALVVRALEEIAADAASCYKFKGGKYVQATVIAIETKTLVALAAARRLASVSAMGPQEPVAWTSQMQLDGLNHARELREAGTGVMVSQPASIATVPLYAAPETAATRASGDAVLVPREPPSNIPEHGYDDEFLNLCRQDDYPGLYRALISRAMLADFQKMGTKLYAAPVTAVPEGGPSRAALIDALTNALAICGLTDPTERREYDEACAVLRSASMNGDRHE